MSDDNHTLPYPDASTEHPTLVIPGAVEAEEARAPRRRRWPWVLLIVVVVLALLAVVAEFVTRSILPGIVRGIVIEQLDLPADQQLDVQAEGVLLPQLIAGRLDELHLSSDSVTLQGITGAADVTATGIPLRGGDLTGATGTVRIDQDQFASLLASSDLPIEEVTLKAPDATVAGSFSVLGMSVPIALTVTPSAEGGDVLLAPGSLTIGGVVLEADEVAQRLGTLGERLTETQRVCIADQLPAGIMLTGLRIEGSAAVIDLDVDGAMMSDQALLEKGTCP